MICFILFCSISALLVRSNEIHKSMTAEQIYDVFQTTSANVPDYKVVPVKHLVHKRSSDDIIIETNINGMDQKLYLKPNKGFLASKTTKIWTAKIDPKNADKLVYSSHTGVMEKIGTFYQDKKTLSALSHQVDENGRSMFDGISGDYVIRPIPARIRRRKDLLEGDLTSHNSKINNTFVNTVDHIIFKRDAEYDEYLNGLHTLDNDHFKPKVSLKSKLGDPQIIYPEIMIFVDDTLFSRFNKNIEKTVQYVLALWNGVDLRYRAFKTPEIFLNIARIILVEGPLSFEENILAPRDRSKIFDEKCLNSFGQFLFNEDKIRIKRNYDVAILMTGRDLINKDYRNSTTGISFVDGACNKSTAAYKIKAVGIIEDNGGFKGIKAGAHELAHLLGAPHDGDEGSSLGGPGAVSCSWDHGYIMSYERFDRKQFHFSSCTQESIAYYTSLTQAECLRNNPADKMGTEQLTRILPGKLMTLDEQCRKGGFYAARDKNATVCLDLWCLERPIGSKGKMSYQSIQAAAEGSYCGDGMFCLDGECVKEAPETD